MSTQPVVSVKQQQMRISRVLDQYRLRHEETDVSAADQREARSFMQETARARPGDPHPLPPQIYNQETYCGDFEDFDFANETGQLLEFLKLKEGEVNLPERTAGPTSLPVATQQPGEVQDGLTAQTGVSNQSGPASAAPGKTIEENGVQHSSSTLIPSMPEKTGITETIRGDLSGITSTYHDGVDSSVQNGSLTFVDEMSPILNGRSDHEREVNMPAQEYIKPSKYPRRDSQPEKKVSRTFGEADDELEVRLSRSNWRERHSTRSRTGNIPNIHYT